MKRVIHENVSRPGTRARWLAALMLLACVGVLSHPADAQLTWETASDYQEQDPNALAFTATFKFENKGEYPLYIRKVECPDRQARVRLISRSKTIRPGESGEVVVRYPNRLLFDEHAIDIQVITDERMNETNQLALLLVPEGWLDMAADEREQLKAEGQRVAIMDAPVHLQRKGVAWRVAKGQAASGKRSVDVRFVDGVEAKVEGLKLVEGDAVAFTTEIIEVVPGQHYRIDVEPAAINTETSEGKRGPRLKRAAWQLQRSLSDEFQQRAVLDGPPSLRAVVLPERSLPRAVLVSPSGR